ncbi:MAG: hypothetical protein FJY74_00470 [Candidatus Eisenbacteria bacterium]|nr:hypothetical protein [Candidatus Eisenbacteria bacterium]
MHRLLAKVLDARAAGRPAAAGGIMRQPFRLRVEVLGSAVRAVKAPGSVTGKRGEIRRAAVLPWAPKRGDLLVLDPTESRRFLAPDGPAPRRLAGAAARLFRGDVDCDGWEEDVFSNAFVSAAVQPHRGARLVSLVGRDGRDRFAAPVVHIMAGQYLLLGGAEEFLPEGSMPGEIWNAAFDREEGDGPRATYRRELKAPEGVTIAKTVAVEADLPGVLELVRLSYAGRPARSADDRGAGGGHAAKDTADLAIGIRMTTPVLGPAGSVNVVEIPSRGELTKVRFHRPAFGRRWRWRDWKDEHFGLFPGFLVSRNEREGNAMAVLFGDGRGSAVSVRSDFEGPEIMLRGRRRAVRKGGSVELGAAFLTADALAATGSSLLLAALGRRRGGAVPLALVVRTSRAVGRPTAALSTAGGGRRAVALRRREIPGAGAVHAAVVTARASDFPIECSVRLGAERLSCVVEE